MIRIINSNCIVYILTFTYLAIWAFIHPPFQAADEFRHYTRIFAVGEGHFILNGPPLINLEVNANIVSPLYDDKDINRLPRDENQKLSNSDLERLLAYSSRHPTNANLRKEVESINYPPIYYVTTYEIHRLLFSGISNYYLDFLLIRISSIIVASFLWLLVYICLKSLNLRPRIYYWLILNPMLAFISSSLNPDAFFIPCGILVMIFLYKSTYQFSYKNIAYLWTIIVLSNFIKPAGLIILITTLATLTILAIDAKRRSQILKNIPFATFSSSAIYFGYFYWNPPNFLPHGAIPFDVTPYMYLKFLTYNIKVYIYQYWGYLGWLDYRLPDIYYSTISILTIFGIASVLASKDSLAEICFLKSMLLFFIINACALFALDYNYIPKVGTQFQGRYLLPTSLGLSSCMFSKSKVYLFLSFSSLAILQILLVNGTIVRYYESSWDALSFFWNILNAD